MSLDSETLTLKDKICLILDQTWPINKHPGELLIRVAKEAGLSLNQVAHGLKVSPNTIYQIAKQERALTPEMALRLARFFDSDAYKWMQIQRYYEMRVARETVDVSAIQPFDYDKWMAELVSKKLKAKAKMKAKTAKLTKSKGKLPEVIPIPLTLTPVLSKRLALPEDLVIKALKALGLEPNETNIISLTRGLDFAINQRGK